MKSTNHTLKQSLKQFKEELGQEFLSSKNISAITRRLVTYTDELLLYLFHKNQLDADNHFCLIALGSYGRRELQLHSDVDILLLHSLDISDIELERSQSFIQDCWDTGMGISHQITSVADCASLANENLTVISTILDMHHLCGPGELMEELQFKTHPLHMWPSYNYFFAKQEEQATRYKKYGETAYNLEPNVKQGPGGLRDLQVLLSISKRHFGIKKFSEGIVFGFITDKEYEELVHCQYFLWRVRFALHLLAGKQEERLLFDYQSALASLFGFTDNPNSLAIEQFMKVYFKTIKRCRELNEILLQWFYEKIVHQETLKIIPLDHSFQLSNNFIEVKHERIFSENPVTLLELFLWLAKNSSIKGIRASTIRLLRENLYLINKSFRKSEMVTSCFLNIFRKGNDPYNALHHMNKYGVLNHYLDCFASATGQMQYDLYHIYTVDQHTLFVIRNLVRFNLPEFTIQFHLAAGLMKKIKKQHILYLAALFHDIAKGRGGDHSRLGAEEALNFSIQHRLNKPDQKLLVWLVENHLLMSHTAQRRDIYDPKTTQAFCEALPEAGYLDYLYLLTVADICATNPSLWNSWKDSLLKELYTAAKASFQQKKDMLDEHTLCQALKDKAMALLVKDNMKPLAVEKLWSTFKNRYFLHESPEMIACHAKAILSVTHYPLVLILPHHTQAGTEVFIYMPHRDNRFIISTTVLHNQHATIQEAGILTCDNHFDLDTYIILDENHHAFDNQKRIDSIQNALTLALSKKNEIPALSKRRLSRAQKHFITTPKISFEDDKESPYTCLFLITGDRPGLLATISRVFADYDINLHNAKITTAGERAEDMFYLSTHEGLRLDESLQQKLTIALTNKLKEQESP